MPSVNRTSSWAAACGIVALLLIVSGGCSPRRTTPPKTTLGARYQKLPPPANLPKYLQGTLLEYCELLYAQPFQVSAFGLVKGLHGTGDTTASTIVREMIRKEMLTHGFGSSLNQYGNLTPEEVLASPTMAIVRVDGYLPPGVRKGQRFDVFVSALDGNNTSSLSHGTLYRTSLKVNGTNAIEPGYAINTWAIAEGAIFVNPAYALDSAPGNTEARSSVRNGVMLHGGIATMDRPLVLRVRQPEVRLARSIEFRIDQAFQDSTVAAAKDEALVVAYVPPRYGADWEHFIQVTMHLYLNSSPDFTVLKARELAEEALKPDAPLLDISYCWEAMGPTILPFVTPLMTNPKSDVAFAAARAAANLGDPAAQTILMEMARAPAHPFQINAVQALARLPKSPAISQTLRSLLDSDQTLLRLEAYKALAALEDPAIITRQIGDKFLLDVIPNDGPPLIYASRSGVPRIAVFGNTPSMALPTVFTAMKNQFSIASEPDRALLNVFYRGNELDKPVSITSSPEAWDLIARLGGEGAPGTPRLQFNYCDVVSLVQAMSDQKRLWAQSGSSRVPVAFVLQEPPRTQETVEQAPIIIESPAIADPQAVGSAANSGMNPGGMR